MDNFEAIQAKVIEHRRRGVKPVMALDEEEFVVYMRQMTGLVGEEHDDESRAHWQNYHHHSP